MGIEESFAALDKIHFEPDYSAVKKYLGLDLGPKEETDMQQR